MFICLGFTGTVSRYSGETVQDEDLRVEDMTFETDRILRNFPGTEEYDMD